MDKINRLLDAMEHPERFNPTEVEEMLHDSDVKEVFDLLDKTKSSLQTITTPDVDNEWRKFESRQRQSGILNRNWLTRLLTRNVAASIAIAVASFTAVAAIVGLHHIITNRTDTAPMVEVSAATNTVSSQTDTIRLVDGAQTSSAEIIVFDEEPLETIINRIAPYYGYQVTFNEEASKLLRLYFRWNQALSLEEVIEGLNNFEQINLTVKDRNIIVD